MSKSVYVFIRTDIPLADQMVQVGHVCMMVGNKFGCLPDTNLVLLALKNELELLNVECDISDKKIAYEISWEPDDDMEYTALATEPLEEEQKFLFKKFVNWEAK